jgi:TolB-like protein
VIDEAAIPADAVRAELDRVLASKGFQSAGRLSRLLRHVTEKTLAGETDQLKEYAVGVEVFDRAASYDPRLDSIVRVEAGRLRSRLDDYYASGGAASEIRIELPRGGYAARFTRQAPRPSVDPQVPSLEPQASSSEPAVTSRKPRALSIVLAGSVLLVIAALSLWLWAAKARPGVPAVAVLPFSQYADDPQLAGVAARLTDDVTSELARLGRVGVVSHTSAMQFAGVKKPLRDIAAALNANFVVEAAIEAEPGGIKVVARLVNASTDRKVWVKDYHGRAEALPDLSRAIAGDIAAAALRSQPAR